MRKTLTALRTRMQKPATRRAIAMANAIRDRAESARLEREIRHNNREMRVYRGEIEDTAVDNWHGTDWGF